MQGEQSKLQSSQYELKQLEDRKKLERCEIEKLTSQNTDKSICLERVQHSLAEDREELENIQSDCRRLVISNFNNNQNDCFENL